MRKGAIISNVDIDSIADELAFEKGDIILSLNGIKPRDIIDYSFLIQNELIEIELERKNGEIEIFEIEKDFEDDLGISFECAVFNGIKPCANHCVFCFVDQQPKGLRDSLYVKDDDWRLSYLQGTYVTLTNLTKSDWARIEETHPSSLFVSIHATNPTVREKLLRNKRAGSILDDLEKLKKLKIDFHGQVVLCPGINDGAELKRTLDDLKKFKNLKSLAIVPVGISKFRKEDIKTVDKNIAIQTIKLVEEFNNDIKKNIAMVSDEFFLLADMDFPEKKYYGKFLQIEDGVGTTRLFLDSLKKDIKKLKKSLKNPVKLTFLISESGIRAFETMKNMINVKNLEIELLVAKNKFFGNQITVAGLLTGFDIIEAIKNRDLENIVLPSLVFKEGSDEFLDGLTLKDVKKHTKANIFINKECYNFSDILTIINSF